MQGRWGEMDRERERVWGEWVGKMEREREVEREERAAREAAMREGVDGGEEGRCGEGGQRMSSAVAVHSEVLTANGSPNAGAGAGDADERSGVD